MVNCLNCIPHCCLYSLFFLPPSFPPSLLSSSSLHWGLSLSPHHISILMVSSHLNILIFSFPIPFSPASRPLTIPFLISTSMRVPSFLSLVSLCLCRFLLSSRLRLARMNEEMREAEAPLGQPGQYPSSSPTEQQYRKCIQEFICLTIEEC